MDSYALDGLDRPDYVRLHRYQSCTSVRYPCATVISDSQDGNNLQFIKLLQLFSFQ